VAKIIRDRHAKTSIKFLANLEHELGFLGIQFGWGLQMANMSPIYKYLARRTHKFPSFGFRSAHGPHRPAHHRAMSDRTWGPLGRRRPYFLVGRHPEFTRAGADANCSALWMAAGLLWILDASINVSMEPFRAFVADKLPERQYGTGLPCRAFLSASVRSSRYVAVDVAKLVSRQQ